MTDTVWQLSEIHKRYRTAGWMGAAGTVDALCGASLTVRAGERLGLIGTSGSGKTTLARVGVGLVRPDTGTVGVLGEDTSRWGRRRWRAACHDVQMLFQDPRAMLNPVMPIGLLLEESAALHRPGADARRDAREALASVGLGDRANALPGALSGGELRRVGLARVMLARPRLLVADEPTTGLDAARKVSLLTQMIDRAGQGCAIVLISHDLRTVLWACHRVVVMLGGRIVDDFDTASLRQGSTAQRHPHTVELMASAGLPVGTTPPPVAP